MPSFGINTRPETFVPLIDETLSQATPDLRQTLHEFIDVMNLTSVANVSVHASMPKEGILTFNVTQGYTSTQAVKFIWLILSSRRQSGDIVFDTLEFCCFWYCFSQCSVATRCRCGGKCDTNLVANLVLLASPRVNKYNLSTFIKVMKEY